MKRIYKAMALCGVAAMSANAHQLPNVGFEGEWTVSTPWNSVSGTSLSMNAPLDRMKGR